MLRTLFQASDDLKIALDGTYAPYSEKRWLRFYSNSYYENYNDVYRLAGGVNYQTDHGSWGGRIVYSQNGYSRDSDSNYYYTSQNYLTRKESRSGMIGDAESENRSIDAGVDFTFREASTIPAAMTSMAARAAGFSYKVELAHHNFKKQLISQRENTETSDYKMTNDGERQYDNITVEVSHALQREELGRHLFSGISFNDSFATKIENGYSLGRRFYAGVRANF